MIFKNYFNKYNPRTSAGPTSPRKSMLWNTIPRTGIPWNTPPRTCIPRNTYPKVV